MIVKKDLAAVNDAMDVLIPTDRVAVAGVQYPTGGTGTLVLEGTITEDHWVALELRSAADATVVATSVNAAGIWFADVSYLKRIRLRKSASAGACVAGLALNHN